MIHALVLLNAAPAAAQVVTLAADNNSGRNAVWVKRYAAGVNSWGIVGDHVPGTNGFIWFNAFPGATGTYKMELGAVLEPDGNSRYSVQVAGTTVAEGRYPYSTGSLDCSAGTLTVGHLPLGTHSVKKGDQIKLWGEAVYPCGTDHGQYTRWYEIRFTPVSASPPATPTEILSPAAGSSLTEGSTVTLRGQGEGTLTWEYDANSDGLGRIAIGTGATVSFTIPLGVSPPKTVTVFLESSSGTNSKQYPIASASPAADAAAAAADGGLPQGDSSAPAAELPAGYLVWSKGKIGDRTSRKIFRLTLPEETEIRALTRGEDVGCQVSYDGKWVAYAKAKIADADYHAFNLWEIYVVHIDGVDAGHPEVRVDEGYWPSWGPGNVLYYSQVDGKHTAVMKVTIDSQGRAGTSSQVLATRALFGSYTEINECFMSPSGDWFAARTRGDSAYAGVGAYQISPPTWKLLGRTGSSGCMPYVAPDGTWGFHSGGHAGVLWGQAPHLPDRQENKTLIPARPGGSCYHPGISTDGRWVMTGHSSDSDQNAGAWDIAIYRLDPTTMTVSGELPLVAGGFNGWPHIWVRPAEATDAGPVGHNGDTASLDAQAVVADAGAGTSESQAPGLSSTSRMSGGCSLAGAAGSWRSPWHVAGLLVLIAGLGGGLFRVRCRPVSGKRGARTPP